VVGKDKAEILRRATLVITMIAALLGVIAYILSRDLFDAIMAVLWTLLFIVTYNIRF
jgi:uncharacterized membrane protein